MPYSAKAVHFNGASYLSNASLVCTNSSKWSASFWFKGIVANAAILRVDPGGADEARILFQPGVDLLFDNGGFSNAPNSTTPLPADTNWHHVLYSYDGTLAFQPAQIYVDGYLINGNMSQWTVTANWNGKDVEFGRDTFGDFFLGDMSDVWIAPDVSLIDPATLTILPATRNLFTDSVTGRPLDPAGFPAGGVIIFKGDHTTFGTNAGSGGAFTLTGVLTDASDTPSTGTIGFSPVFRFTAPNVINPTVEAGWSDPQSHYAYMLYLDGPDANWTSVKIDKSTNTVVQTAVIVDAPPPVITRLNVSGMVGPWSDATRMFAVCFDGGGSNNWYVTTLSRSTLLPTHNALVTTNAFVPVNNPEDISCSADGTYVAFCNNSAVVPNAGESAVSVYNSGTDAFARTTATSLGITMDSFQCLTMDAANNIYCGGQDRKVYKLAFNPGTLVSTLTATFDLTPFFPAPNGRWQTYSIAYREPTNTLLVFVYDTGGTPLASRMVEIDTSGALVNGPHVFLTGWSYNPFGELSTPTISHWTNKTKFVCATFTGANTNLQVIDITGAGSITTFPDSNWVNATQFMPPGLADYDAVSNTIWIQTETIPSTQGFAQIGLLGLPVTTVTVPLVGVRAKAFARPLLSVQVADLCSTPLPGPSGVTKIIPSYLYQEYQDDENLQGFVDAYNQLSQEFLDWFNAVILPFYPELAGLLLDWVAEGLYGMTRPVLPFGLFAPFGSYNSAPYDSFFYNEFIPNHPVPGTKSGFGLVSDDVFKRILTWHFFKGDGKVFTMRWLKRRVQRFLTGINGLQPQCPPFAETYRISVTVDAEDVIHIGIINHFTQFTFGAVYNNAKFGYNQRYYDETHVKITLLPPFTLAPVFKAAMDGGALEMPFQFKTVVTI